MEVFLYAALSVLPLIWFLRLAINCCNNGLASTSVLFLLYNSTSSFCELQTSTFLYQSLPGFITSKASSPCSHHCAISSPVFSDGTNAGLPINKFVRSFDADALCFVSI